MKNMGNINGVFEIYLKVYFSFPSFLDIRTSLYNLKKKHILIPNFTLDHKTMITHIKQIKKIINEA